MLFGTKIPTQPKPRAASTAVQSNANLKFQTVLAKAFVCNQKAASRSDPHRSSNLTSFRTVMANTTKKKEFKFINDAVQTDTV